MTSRMVTSSSVSPSEYSVIGEKNTSTISSLNSFMVSSLASLAMADSPIGRPHSPINIPGVIVNGNNNGEFDIYPRMYQEMRAPSINNHIQQNNAHALTPASIFHHEIGTNPNENTFNNSMQQNNRASSSMFHHQILIPSSENIINNIQQNNAHGLTGSSVFHHQIGTSSSENFFNNSMQQNNQYALANSSMFHHQIRTPSNENNMQQNNQQVLASSPMFHHQTRIHSSENSVQQNNPRVLTGSSMLTTGDSMDVQIDNNTTYLTNNNNVNNNDDEDDDDDADNDNMNSSMKSYRQPVKKAVDFGNDIVDYNLGEDIPLMLSMMGPSTTVTNQGKTSPSVSKTDDVGKECFDRFLQEDLCLSYGTMEPESERRNKLINDMPHIVTMKLIKSLDNDGEWEDLASLFGFNFEEIATLKMEEKRSASPTRKLLWRVSCRGGTVQLLRDKLCHLNRVTDVEIIDNYMTVCKTCDDE